VGDHAESDPLWSFRPGVLSYSEGSEVQARLAELRRRDEVPDCLLLLEHWPVLTKGRRSEPAELGMGEDWYRMQGIEVCETDRGGRVTYHGPGQLVAYPIIHLGAYGDDVAAYVRRLERVMIAVLADYEVPAQVFDGLTGVWAAGDPPIAPGEVGPQGTAVGEAAIGAGTGPARKVGSIGVHVSRGITTHGLAINVNNDLQPFNWIVPCGIEHAQPTSLARELGGPRDLGEFAAATERHFGEVFERRIEQHEELPVAVDY
jgi:lipoyl(octanoyl) transferase